MVDLERERQIVLIVETAQLELKKIIQQGILFDKTKEQLKLETTNLIEQTKLKMRELEVDEAFIQETEFAIKRSFMLWYNNIYKQVIKTQGNAKLPHIDSDMIQEQRPATPIIKKDTGGMTISGGSELRQESIGNIREFQTLYDEGASGYYYDYTSRVKQAMDELAVQHLGVDKYSLRNKAEIKVRYDVINEDLNRLKEKGVQFVISSSHSNASERCQWWQGKIYILDIDVATREMGQYDGVKPKQTIKGYIDGKPYYSLKEACENGFLSYNCQHRLIAYYKGIHIPKLDNDKVEQRRNVSQHQRYLERQIRYLRTKLQLAINKDERKQLREQIKQLKEQYVSFCKNNNVPIYEWRTKIID